MLILLQKHIQLDVLRFGKKKLLVKQQLERCLEKKDLSEKCELN